MARTPRDESVQTALRLPRALHDKLKAAGGERGISEEIRQRLEASFAGGPALGALLQDIATVASTLEIDAGWTADVWSFDALKAAVNALIEAHRPKGTRQAEHILFQPTDNPETVGRSLAATARSARQEK